MSWLAPWSWLGLGLLALPILIHLLSRRPAQRVTFPSLRFIAPMDVVTSQRTRITDWPLLFVRLSLIAAAVVALAQPASPRRSSSEVPRVALVVDAATVDAAIATRDASRRAGTAPSVFSSPQLQEGIARAVEWLRRQPAPRALEIASTMAAGRIDSLMLAALPRDVSVRLTTYTRQPASARTDTIVWITRLSGADAESVIRTVSALGGAPVVQESKEAPCAPRTGAVEAMLCVNTVRAAPPAASDSAVRSSVLAVEVEQRVRQAWPDGWGAPPAVHQLADGVVQLSAARDSPDAAVSMLLAAGGAVPPVSVAPPIDKEQLARWAAVPSGAPIGEGTASRDVHAQPTLARFIWMIVLLLLLLEWRMRRRGVPAAAVVDGAGSRA
jgi:hypothetical protein